MKGLVNAQLTKAEEQIMQALWELEQGTVQDIRDRLEEAKPARTTVATVLTILENKGFVSHISQGRANIYKPLISKEGYSKSQLSGLLKNYFNNSFASMASFFARENNYSIEELDLLIKDTKEELNKEKNNK
ncbi:BlaI/MecI/CopY family transcriptional regulator [Pedobacter sp. LMG 31462]|uniref:BlaI/MecI/CopY family transcriptional regulator n=2 Tax=Pedobacter gandavensis TaxID=2679963 RepID=A0ABR6EQN5_9SPHI|nr:BlaI/MecI/CopY family transcriptional regulator [Pedobacter gandavensis]